MHEGAVESHEHIPSHGPQPDGDGRDLDVEIAHGQESEIDTSAAADALSRYVAQRTASFIGKGT